MKYKNVKYLLFFILIMFTFPLTVFAQNKIVLSTDKTDLGIGDELTVSAQMSSDDELYAMTATLSYDESVFETIDDRNFEEKDNWSDIVYNSTNKKFGLINKSGEISKNLLSFHLRVKDGANVGSSIISLNNIEASDGTGENKVFNNVSTEVFVSRDAKDKETIPTKEIQNENQKSEDNVNTLTNHPIIIITGILTIVLIIVCLLIITDKIKVKNKRQTTLILIAILLASLITSVILLFVNGSNKDVDKDGKTGYEDAKEIIEYIIDMKGTKEKSEKQNKTSNKASNLANTTGNISSFTSYKPNMNRADINNDGKADVKDVAHATKANTNKNYKVTLSNSSNSDIYAQKGKNYTLTFNASVKPYADIKQVVINGKTYKVFKKDGYYAVTIKAPNKAGTEEVKITKVILDNKREIKVSYKRKIEVLKAEPKLTKFNVDDETNELSFTITDLDNSLINGTIKITDEKGATILSKKVITGENSYIYDFEKDKKYNVIITGTYDLDSTLGNKYYYKNKVFIDTDIEILQKYDFKINNIEITESVSKGESAVITFESTNITEYDIKTVTINGKEYEVLPTNKKNQYQIIMPAKEEYGKYTLNIEKITLTNGKTFQNKKDFEVEPLVYGVLKTAPKVDNINLTEDADAKTIKVTFDTIDNDSTLSNINAILLDGNGDIVGEENVNNKNEVTFTYESNSTAKFTVEFRASYSLGVEGYSYTDKLIGEESIYTESRLYFTDSTSSKKYVKKNEELYLYYYIYVPQNFEVSSYPTNITDLITSITVNGLNYVAKKETYQGRGRYVVNITAPDKAGVVTTLANRVMFFNTHTYWLKPAEVSFEVLKDKPVVENFKVENEDYENNTVTFSFELNDDNGGLDSGVIVLDGKEKEVKKGKNTVTLENITKDELFSLEIKANYDLDSDKDNGENYYTNDTIFETPYGLYDEHNYDNLKISNIKATSKKDNIYFEKEEDINLNFNFTGLEENTNFELDKIVILEKEYKVQKNEDGTYNVKMNGFDNAGVKHFEISDVILNSGKKIALKDKQVISIEVLKDVLTITDFSYKINQNNIDVNMKLNDQDESLINKATVKILDEDSNVLSSTPYSNNITFAKKNNVDRYYVQVYATYDRDTNKLTETDNKYQDKLMLNEVVSLDKHYLELKNITSFELYKNDNGNDVIIDEITKEELDKNLKDYFLKIEMSDMPSFYSNIKETVIENGHLILVLDYEYATLGNDGKKENLRIDFGEIKDGTASNEVRPETFEEFVNRLKDNPSEEITLTNDLDASGYESDSDTIIDFDFSGTLNGNGYSIKNLNKPLFNKLTGTVKNIGFENVTLPGSKGNGTVAITADGANISGVLIEGLNKINMEGAVGCIVGTAQNNTTIENSKATSFKITSSQYSHQQIGGLVGVMKKSTIKNSYAIGTITNGWNFRGGLVGNITDVSYIENSYAKVNIDTGWGSNLVCGIACGGSGNFTNVVSLSSGSLGNKFAGGFKSVSNNYYLIANETDRNDQDGITGITEKDVTQTFFENNVKFSEDVWNMKDASYLNPPTLNIEFKSALSKDSTENNDLYDKNKELLYRNLSRLTPFYDSDSIIKTGSKISENSLLNTQEITHIIPLDNEGKLVTYLTLKDYKKINSIKVIFKNNVVKDYSVSFDNLYDKVVGYRINDLKIDYTFNHYMINSESDTVKNLVEYLESLDYTKDLDPLTSKSDSRIYRDFYNDTTRKELKEFVLKYISNSDSALAVDTAGNHAEKQLKQDDKLIKALYVYNYYNRFYSVNIEGIMLDDLLFFNGQGFSKNINPDNITELMLTSDNNFETYRTNDTYVDTLAKYTNYSNLPRFLDYLVRTLTDLTPDEWFAKEFKNILVEVPVDGRQDIDYTMWDHLSHEDNTNWRKWHNYILPIITLPKNSTYIISSPTQFLIGSQRTYVKNPNNEADAKEIQSLVDAHAAKIKSYYNTAAGIIEDASIFNAVHGTQLDQRYTLDSNGNSQYQSRLATEEDFHKNYNEVMGHWKEMDGNAATSNGTDILWNAHQALKDFSTWSHEQAHNTDDRIFYKNKGQRFDVGGEDCADSNLSQFFGAGDISMNLTFNFNETERMEKGTNWTTDRINDPDKIYDYYRKVFETVYIMDYLEAQAFLKLTPDEQRMLSVKVTYPNDPEPENPSDSKYKAEYRKRLATRYLEMTEEEFSKLELKDMDDLYDNRIVIFPGVIYSTVIDNRYGGENIFRTRWYQAHNDKGRADSQSFKWFAYEMLGYKGYDDGYIEFYSNTNSITKQLYNEKGELQTYSGYKTDLMALQTITGDPDMSFRTYKLNRFKEVENNLQYIQHINVGEMLKRFYDALKEDAKVVKEAESKEYQDTTARNNAISKARAYNKSTALRKEIYYTLKTVTNDFRGEIYDKNNPHEIEDFQITKNSSKTVKSNENKVALEKSAVKKETSNKEEENKEKEIKIEDELVD